MNSGAINCPSCGKVGFADGVCSHCGYTERETLITPTANRGAMWAVFLAIFLGTPVLALVAGAQGIVPVLAMGTLASGFLLARLFAKDSVMFIILGLAFRWEFLPFIWA